MADTETPSDESTGEYQALEGPPPEDRSKPRGKRNAQGQRVDPTANQTSGPERVILSALVAHEPGVLAQVASLFRRRQFNIESLTVGPTEHPDRARITLVVDEPRSEAMQAKKQLRSLIPVVTVRELATDAVVRELALIKVDADNPAAVQSLAEMYGGQTVDAGQETVTVELTGSRQKLEAAVDAFQRFGLREVTRTGQAALARGTDWTAPVEDEWTADADPLPPVEADD